jgi:hypothetical protein
VDATERADAGTGDQHGVAGQRHQSQSTLRQVVRAKTDYAGA